MKQFTYFLFFISFALIARAQESVNIYNNYEFIPGEKVLFEDNFADTKEGKFPSRWNLISRQGMVTLMNGEPTFAFTDATVGGPGKISPRLKTPAYLTSSFTIEEDFFLPETEMTAIYFKDKQGKDDKYISLDGGGVIMTNYFEKEMGGQYPNNEDLQGKWHHLALDYMNKQIKIYVDQYRVLVIPDCGFEPQSLIFGGSMNVKIRNVKIANTDGTNMLDKISTEGKFISHAVTFYPGKPVIKGESMGFLNELSKWLKANPNINLEIGVHTNNEGEDSTNLKLSQLRAEAIKTLLVAHGIQSNRLTAKGYGITKPIDKNTTPEGKANNQRVEFVKK